MLGVAIMLVLIPRLVSVNNPLTSLFRWASTARSQPSIGRTTRASAATRQPAIFDRTLDAVGILATRMLFVSILILSLVSR